MRRIIRMPAADAARVVRRIAEAKEAEQRAIADAARRETEQRMLQRVFNKATGRPSVARTPSPVGRAVEIVTRFEIGDEVRLLNFYRGNYKNARAAVIADDGEDDVLCCCGLFNHYIPRCLLELAYTQVDNVWFDSRTRLGVIGVLVELLYANDKQKVLLSYGDPDTGREILRVHGMTGHIGLTTGPKPMCTLLRAKNHRIGEIIETRNILKIRTLEPKPRELYRHPEYSRPSSFVIETEHTPDGYAVHTVHAGDFGYEEQDQILYGFASKKTAEAWIKQIFKE